jgi:hypothetical protein
VIEVERLHVVGVRNNAWSKRSVATTEPFLKGPIPLRWLTAAAHLPGRAFQVAIAIWFLVGIQSSRTVRLAPKVRAQFIVDRHAAYRGLEALERAHLVSVVRHRGRAPNVTILEGGSNVH